MDAVQSGGPRSREGGPVVSAESDARTLANLRRWLETNAETLAKAPNWYRVPIYLDEFDVLLRLSLIHI